MKAFLLPLILIANNSADIERHVNAYLQARYPVERCQYVFEFSELDMFELAEFDSVAVGGFGKAPPRCPVDVRVALYRCGEPVKRLAVVIRAGVMQGVPVSTIAVGAGGPLMASGVETATGNNVFPGDVPGWSLKRTVECGACQYMSGSPSPTLSCVHAPSRVGYGDIWRYFSLLNLWIGS